MARNELLSNLPKFRRGSLALFAATALMTVLLADQPIAAQLRLLPSSVYSGATVWAPLSATFVFPDASAGMVIGTLIIQWFIGGQLEDFWGTKKYVLLVLGCSIAGYLGSTLLGLAVPAVAQTVVGGSGGMDLATITAFGVVFGKRDMSLLGAVTLKARTFAIVLGVLALVSPLARGAPWPVAVPWIVAIAGALLVTMQPWRRQRSSGKLGGRRKKSKGRANLRVVRPDDELLN